MLCTLYLIIGYIYSCIFYIGCAEIAKAIKYGKELGCKDENLCTSATTIAERARERFCVGPTAEIICRSFPQTKKFADIVNGYRKQTRPKEPVDMNFDIDVDHIGHDFFRGDVTVGNRRHVMFSMVQLSC